MKDYTFSGSNENDPGDEKGCSLDQLTRILDIIPEQGPWRAQADREADFIDGNQLNSEQLEAQMDKGVPPSIENLMGIQILTAYGKAAANKKDAKVIVEQEGKGEEVAEALNVKLNKAEKTSGADKACLLAHFKQIGVGIGWVEIVRESNPFKPPYRTKEVNRNEIWWDMTATEPDLSDAMWLLRRRWTNVQIAMQKFKGSCELIKHAGTGWQSYDYSFELDSDGGTETGLYQSRDIERGWSVEDQEWKDDENERICIFEVLTRHYITILIIRMPDGRIIKYNKEDPLHHQAVAIGLPLEKADISEIYKSYYLGPHFLGKEKLSAPDGKFNYVQFINRKEDRTGIPFGVARGMMSLQEEHNARVSSMVWGLGSVRTTFTEGAVLLSDEELRNSVGRRDAQIKLDRKEMMAGGIFKVERDYDLNTQQYQRMEDLRSGIERQSLMSDAFRGGGGTSNTASGLKIEVEQSNQSTAGLTENYEYGRMQVLDHILWMIIEDSQDEEDVFVSGGLIKDDRVITLNKPTIDEATGVEYKNNDVAMIRMAVALADVPSNPSLAQQELMSLTEFAKASMPEIQAVLAPHIANLSSIPNKEEIVEAIRQIIDAPSEEATLKRIEDAVDAAGQKAQHELKSRELDIKESKTAAEIDKIVSEAVNNSLEAFYSATQAGMQIASAPAIAPIADQLLQSAGYEDKNAAPIIPGPVGVPVDQAVQPNVVQNTSPQFPPRVQEPDMLEPEPQMPQGVDSPAAGMNEGIETQGVV